MRRTASPTLITAAFLALTLAPVSWSQPPRMKMTTYISPAITTPDRMSTSGELEFFYGVQQENGRDGL